MRPTEQVGDAGQFALNLLSTADGRQRCIKSLGQARRAYKEGLDRDADGFPQWEVCAAATGMEDRGEQLRVLGQVRVLHADAEMCELPGVAILTELSFRGTASQENMVMNLLAQTVPLTIGPSEGLIHRGFQEAYLALRTGLLEKLDSVLVNKCASYMPTLRCASCRELQS
eukprot:TRINITY_DN76604_c0_g1_i1.p1 TRINITY_DN76604_c0_g1~~TRINITY_DN76604_c0_g1_i1.p1  ORF type:complete len:171 (+),score=22.68 TRINITY_DN76604_c0_g1_i1:116-628(+)